MIKRTRNIFFLSIFTFTSSCSLFNKSNLVDADLDISERKQSKDLSNNKVDEKYDPIVIGTNEGKVNSLPVAAFFSMPKDFFNPAPTDDERSVLEKSASTLSSSKDLDKILVKARAQVALGQIKEGMDNYRHYLHYRSNNQLVSLELAMSHIRLGQIDESLSLLYKIKNELTKLEGQKDLPVFVYRYVLALCYIEKGKLQNARDILAELLQKDKSFVAGYVALASSFVNENKIDTAEFVVKRALDRTTEDASLFNLLGAIGQKRLDFGSARKHFEKALSINKNFVPAILNLALLDLNAKDFAAAKQHLFRATKLAPYNGKAYTLQGLIDLRQKDYNRARLSFMRAIELAPNDPYSRYNLAVLYYERLNQPGKALRLFHEVVSVAENDPEVAVAAKSYIGDIKG